MIPKTIHYCWYGGNPLPDLAKKCIASWKQYCPDYKIIQWDESNTDICENDYVKEAHDNKKWAYITDYTRLNVLYKYGGIYMDTDVELVKPIDEFLENPAFSGFENESCIPTGIMGAEKAHPFIKELLCYYNEKHFINADGTLNTVTNVEIITDIASHKGFIPNDTKQAICGMVFYPHDYFCPKNYYTGRIKITKNTICIHHFDGSWMSDVEKYYLGKRRFLNTKYGQLGEILYYIFRYFLHPKQILRKVYKSDRIGL